MKVFFKKKIYFYILFFLFFIFYTIWHTVFAIYSFTSSLSSISYLKKKKKIKNKKYNFFFDNVYKYFTQNLNKFIIVIQLLKKEEMKNI